MKLSPLSNLKYSHLQLGTPDLQKYINCIHISVSKYNRNMILVSIGPTYIFEVNNCTRNFFKVCIQPEKTEVLHIGHQREELDIELEGKKLTQRDSFVYLGGAVCGDWKTEREVRRIVQAGANAWRAVEGVMADRRISNRLKGKVMSTCVTPACLYGTETLALTELQQQRLQVCENNWVRKLAGVQRSLTERLVRSRLQWAGYVERIADDRLPKRAAELR